MSIFSWITGGGKQVDKALSMVDRGLDALVFTQEEKSVANQKVLDFKLNWIKATGPQNAARRVIAYGVCGLWALMLVLGMGLQLFGNVEDAKFIFKMMDDLVNTPFMIIIGFYFAAHIVRAYKK